MKLFSEWKKIYIGEARRNPEQNPKVSAYEQLKPYFDDENAYISFTSVDKLGINPRSKFNTPLGIYSYPLKEIKEFYDDTNNDWDKTEKINVPFAGDRDYIWLFFPKRPDRVLELSEYSSADWDRDVKILRKIAKKHNILNYFNDMISEAKYNARVRNPAGYFWYITMVLSETIEQYTKKSIMRWNSIFRELGYDGITDKKGQGIIHELEPVQAVWFSKEAINVEDKILNKDYGKKLSEFSFNELMYTFKSPSDKLRVAFIEFVFIGKLPEKYFRDYFRVIRKLVWHYIWGDITEKELFSKIDDKVGKFNKDEKYQAFFYVDEERMKTLLENDGINFLEWFFVRLINTIRFYDIINKYANFPSNNKVKSLLDYLEKHTKNIYGEDSEEMKYFNSRRKEL